jgi:exodeoxyribonuclease VII small subunit
LRRKKKQEKGRMGEKRLRDKETLRRRDNRPRVGSAYDGKGKIQNLKSIDMAKKEFSFNNAVIEIEEILHKIENGDLDIDKLSIEVRRASELIKECQKKLRSTEDEINSIFKEMV